MKASKKELDDLRTSLAIDLMLRAWHARRDRAELVARLIDQAARAPLLGRSVSSTYTYAILVVSPAVFTEIKARLKNAGYDHAFNKDDEHGTVIDMHGIAVAEEARCHDPVPPNQPASWCEICGAFSKFGEPWQQPKGAR